LSLTYAGNLENLKNIAVPNYTFIKVDIRNREKMIRFFFSYTSILVVNFVAESHVNRSIVEREMFLTTNIFGTQVNNDTAKKYWKVNPDDKYSMEHKPCVKHLQVVMNLSPTHDNGIGCLRCQAVRSSNVVLRVPIP
jgi:dTDP-glucose 4,6-dehydratase